MEKYVITYLSDKTGLRTLLGANQGQRFALTAELAQESLDATKDDYLRNKIISATEHATLAVRSVECYESGDAKGIYFDNVAIIKRNPPESCFDNAEKLFSLEQFTGVSLWVEITEDRFSYALNVLPPIYVGVAFMMGEPYADTDDGRDTLYFGFVHIDGRFFMRLAPRKQFASMVGELIKFVEG
jgi:hypothetical protein